MLVVASQLPGAHLWLSLVKVSLYIAVERERGAGTEPLFCVCKGGCFLEGNLALLPVAKLTDLSPKALATDFVEVTGGSSLLLFGFELGPRELTLLRFVLTDRGP